MNKLFNELITTIDTIENSTVGEMYLKDTHIIDNYEFMINHYLVIAKKIDTMQSNEIIPKRTQKFIMKSIKTAENLYTKLPNYVIKGGAIEKNVTTFLNSIDKENEIDGYLSFSETLQKYILIRVNVNSFASPIVFNDISKISKHLKNRKPILIYLRNTEPYIVVKIKDYTIMLTNHIPIGKQERKEYHISNLTDIQGISKVKTINDIL